MPSSLAGAETPMPIAVIGLACRLPGEASDPLRLWRMMSDAKSAYSEVPTNRYNIDAFHGPQHGRSNTVRPRGGHFLPGDPAAWDAPFFGVTANEARSMDPQQRFMLEVAYEGFENAGLPMESLVGSDTSCYVGCFTRDFTEMVVRDPEVASMYTATGTGISLISNRVSWFYDLRGASMTLDTACSSSLVGLHLACQNLRAGESKMALCGGSNLLLSPDLSMWMSNLNFLSPDGLSKSFDASANGYSRGEGFATIILKPLPHAIRDGNTIRAVIRGTGINQDGRTPGITLPRSEAQSQLIRSTYAAAGLDFSRTRYFEAHGTGTPAGDPLELQAIANTFGTSDRRAEVYYVGSIKSNIGHLEGAAGLAGVIKSILILERGIIPPNLHFKSPNPQIPFDASNIRVPTTNTAWPSEGLRRISVNSFGYGGTNAHVILDDAGHFLEENSLIGFHNTSMHAASPSCATGLAMEYEPKVHSKLTSRENVADDDCVPARLLVFSAQDEHGLQRVAEGYVKHLKGCTSDMQSNPNSQYFSNLAYTLGTRRSRLTWRSFTVANSVEELTRNLSGASMIRGKASNPPRVAFLFTGQGAQWPRMGIGLIRYQVFRESISNAGKYLKTIGCTWSALEELDRNEPESHIHLAEYSQPLCTIIQIAMVELLISWGVETAAVVGHSSGEIAAAYALGAISRTDGWALAYHRGRLSAQLSSEHPNLRGAMMAVGVGENEFEHYNQQLTQGKVVVACVNSPTSITVSGDEAGIDELKELLDSESRFSRKLKVENAYHSHHMESIATDYHSAIQHISSNTTRKNIKMFSSVTGHEVESSNLGASYWVANLLSPVLFSTAIQTLLSHGHRRRTAAAPFINLFLEIGPHSTMSGPLGQILEHHSKGPIPYSSMLTRNCDAALSALECAGSLLIHGVQLSLENVNTFVTDHDTPPVLLVNLPPYPWDHTQTYWAESRISRGYRFRKHPSLGLLGPPVSDYNNLRPRWRTFLNARETPWIRDHQVQNSIIYPAAGMIVMVLEAARQIADPDRAIDKIRVKDCKIGKAIIISNSDAAVEVTLEIRHEHVGSDNSLAYWSEFSIFTYSDDDAIEQNCTGLFSIEYKGKSLNSVSQLEVDCETSQYQKAGLDYQKLCQSRANTATFYEHLTSLGLGYGPAFRNITTIHHGNQRSLCTIKVPDTTCSAKDLEQSHVIHPATLDCIFQTIFAAINDGQGSLQVAAVPTFIQSIEVSTDIPNAVGSEFYGLTRAKRHGLRELCAEITMGDKSRAVPSIVIKGFCCKELSASVTDSTTDDDELGCLENRCLEVSTMPDVSLVSRNELKLLMENSCMGQAQAARDTVAKKDLAALIFMEGSLKAITPVQVLKGHLRLFYSWMCDQVKQFGTTVSNLSSVHEHCSSLSGLERGDILSDVEAMDSEGKTICIIGQHLEEILTSQIEPLELLLEDDLLSRYYQDVTGMSVMNAKLGAFIDLAAHKNPNLSILEIGAGTGGTTHAVLSKLGGDTNKSTARFSHYMFTDISAGFFDKAATRFGAWKSRLHFQVLNVEQDPLNQGFQAATYDLVIASNVLHATRSIDQTLQNIARTLKPGGKLCLTEITTCRLRTALIFGSLPGWWSGEHDGRHGGPTLSLHEWDESLKRNGFTGIDVATPDSCMIQEEQMNVIISSRVQPAIASISTDDGEVLILHPASPSQKILDTSTFITKHLQARQFRADSLPWQSEVNTVNRDVIAILELESPFLADMTEQNFNGLKSALLDASSTLWVTAGVNAENGVVLGLARCMRNEDPNLRLRTLELRDPNFAEPRSMAQAIEKVFIDSSSETEFVVENGMVNIRRVVQGLAMTELVLDQQPSAPLSRMQLRDVKGGLTLDIGAPGVLDTLHFKEAPLSMGDLAEGEVEILVKASGLNFRDIMVSMGQIADTSLGLEASGIVLRVGSGVSFKPGDRVFAAAKGTYKNILRTNEMLCQLIPGNISYEEAASIPIIFGTVYQALTTAARIQPGQSVLIHSAAGGVGQAAIQLARHYGAIIFATVSSREKRDFLKSTYDIVDDHIFNSRDLSFVKGVMRMTNNRGVDVILNSLSGEALQQTWQCIAPFGTFVEIGKKDILDNVGLSMRPFLSSTTFTSVNLDLCLTSYPSVMAETTRNVFRLLTQGAIKAVSPVTVYPSSKIEDAFRFMQGGRHVGKIVVSFDDNDSLPIHPSAQSPLLLDSSATYVLTGGLGGLGRSISRFLVHHGARHIAFISRTGAASESAMLCVQELQDTGVDVNVYSCDISNKSALIKTLALCTTEMPKIRGLVQGAMVLSDAIFANMTHQQWVTATRPKIQGSRNLHQLLPRDLDFFVLLSSMIGMTGNPSQANYAAGNTYQDALARCRRDEGLPGTSIDLGLMLDLGAIAERGGGTNLKVWDKFGINEAFLHSLLKAALTRNAKTPAQTIVGLATGGQCRNYNLEMPFYFNDAKFGMLKNMGFQSDRATSSHAPSELLLLQRQLMTSNSKVDAGRELATALAKRVAKNLRTPLQNIDVAKPLHAYGVDSLVAVEIRHWIVRDIKAEVSLFDVLGSMSIESLAFKIAEASTLLPVDKRS